MNKTLKSKRIKWGMLTVVCCLICLILLNVGAKASLPNAKVKKVAKKTCDIEKYTTNIEITTAETGATVNITAKGSFWLFIYQYNNETEKAELLEENISFKDSYTKNLGTDPTYEVFTILVYKGDGPEDTNCNGASYADAKKIADDYVNNYKFVLEKNEKNELDKEFIKEKVYAARAEFWQIEVPNVSEDGGYSYANDWYNTICKDFRNGTYNAAFEKFKSYWDKYVEARKTNASLGESLVEYCYAPTVESNYTEAQLKSVIKNALKIYFANATSSNPNFGTLKGSATEVTKTDLTSTPLQCSKDQLTKTTEEGYYTNENSYYYSGTETTVWKDGEKYKDEDGKEWSGITGQCTRTCEEKITVKYGPPVASKAGMCFEYKVKVESKVECQSTYTGSPPQKQQACKIYPICNSSEKWFDQAGPEENFDACILECDGGKYSQSCINSCYKKTYDQAGAKAISYEDSESPTVSQLSGVPGYWSTSAEFCAGNGTFDLTSTGLANFNNLVNSIKNDQYYNGIQCGYEYRDGKIIWNCADAYKNNQLNGTWASLGKYYFSSALLAERTVNSISKTCPGEWRSFGGRYRYFIDQYGFKRAILKSGKPCSEKCRWVKSSLSSANCVLNATEATKNYEQKLEAYAAQVNACKAAASCSKETAEFTISVNNKLSDGKDNIIDFTKAEITNTNGVIKGADVNNQNSILISSGQCYGKNKGDYDYMAEWSFPGTWINNKTGEVLYQKPCSSETDECPGWKYKSDKFCSSLDSTDVNTEWWNWNQLVWSKDNNAKYSGAVEDWNITANTRNFGHFKWNIDISCFYAINDKGCPPGDPDCPDDSCTNPPCDRGTYKYRIRSINTKEIFPDESREDDKTGKKTIGYNWQGASTQINANTTDYGYDIAPAALIKSIEEKTNVYNDNDKEYSFYLTKQNLISLSKKKNNHMDFEGEFFDKKTDNDAIGDFYYYKSKIIRDSALIKTIKIKRKPGCNNWNGTGCTQYSIEEMEAAGGVS